jgi:regulator of protease activity HflC (stomatin/prohibitin superfamily)
MLSTLIDYLLSLADWAWRVLLAYARRHPIAVALVILAIIRSFGTTVRSGQAGVLFFCGRARKVLQPGFHPLIPVFHAVRKLPVRSVTLNLPKQRLTAGDGLVYDVYANIVYRVEDPIKAVTLVDDRARGVANVVPLVVHELLHEKGRAELADREALNSELIERCRQRLACWGLAVEDVGLSSIAPSRRTIRLTQLRGRVMERRRLMKHMLESAEADDNTVALLLASGGNPPLGHSTTRYRQHRRVRALQRRHRRVVLAPPLELELRTEILLVDRDLRLVGAGVTAQALVARVQQRKPHFSEATILDRVKDLERNGSLKSFSAAAAKQRTRTGRTEGRHDGE